jgi:hypothetical protein
MFTSLKSKSLIFFKRMSISPSLFLEEVVLVLGKLLAEIWDNEAV